MGKKGDRGVTGTDNVRVMSPTVIMTDLGASPETSHLNCPLVSLLTFLRMMWVGWEESETSRPEERNTVTWGTSENDEEDLEDLDDL